MVLSRRKGEKERILFELLVYSGLRLKHAIRLLSNFDKANLIVVNEKVSRYPINFVSRGKKKAYWAYMPTDFAKKLRRINLDYGMRDHILHGKVSATTIRKWHANFLIENGVPESIVEFIHGRADVSIGSAHYYHKTKQADNFYSKVVDKFPIKEV